MKKFIFGIPMKLLMKYWFAFSLLLCSYFSLLAQVKDYTITASIKKYPSDAMAFLYYKGLDGRFVDSVAIENGSFTFRGKIDEPRPATIVLKETGKKIPSHSYLNFYIEPGNLILTSKSMLSTVDISGSPASLEKKELDKLEVNGILAPVSKMVVTQTTRTVGVPSGSGSPSSMGSGRTMAGGPSTSTRTITDMSQLPMEVQQAIRRREEEAKNKALKFVKDHPKSFVSIYTLNALWTLKKISYAEYYGMLNILDPSVLGSNEGRVMFAGSINPK